MFVQASILFLSEKVRKMDKDVKRGRCFGDNEERKLELRLGPPGEDWLEIKEENEKDHIFNSVLSLSPFSNASKPMAAHLSAGTKRGFFESIEPKAEGVLLIFNI